MCIKFQVNENLQQIKFNFNIIRKIKHPNKFISKYIFKSGMIFSLPVIR